MKYCCGASFEAISSAALARKVWQPIKRRDVGGSDAASDHLPCYRLRTPPLCPLAARNSRPRVLVGADRRRCTRPAERVMARHGVLVAACVMRVERPSGAAW